MGDSAKNLLERQAQNLLLPKQMQQMNAEHTDVRLDQGKRMESRGPHPLPRRPEPVAPAARHG